jgi:O-antigen/teichoic acid export membrane protein
MSVKKNFVYNSILLVSQYIFPMLLFPYVTRVFGAGTLGLVSFVDGIADYFILFSTLGLTLTGIRAVAKNRDDKAALSKTFSELLTIHLISTLLFITVYVILIFSVDKLHNNMNLFFISISKLLFNVFLVEWFYKGIENFKFITVRTVFIKVVYILMVFLLVKTKQDYPIYYILTCSVVIINAIVNFSFTRGKIWITFRNLDLKQHLKPFFTVGLYLIVTSMYTSFNIGFLGFVSSTTSVGYYSTASKLFSIILGFFSALNMVLMPRLSSLMVKDDQQEFMKLINKSFNFVAIFCFPIIMCGSALAAPIIHIAAGQGFNGAIICFKLILPLIFVLGVAQILANQILMTIKKDNELLIASVIGGVIGLVLNILLVPRFHEVGTSYVLLVSEIAVTIALYYFTVKLSAFRIPYKFLLMNLVCSIPYLVICYLFSIAFNNPFWVLAASGFVSLLYFTISQLFIIKSDFVLDFFNSLIKKKLVFNK